MAAPVMAPAARPDSPPTAAHMGFPVAANPRAVPSAPMPKDVAATVLGLYEYGDVVAHPTDNMAARTRSGPASIHFLFVPYLFMRFPDPCFKLTACEIESVDLFIVPSFS